MKNKIKNLTYLFIVGLILVLLGITYSFFSFTAFSNELVTNSGEVYMRLNKSNTNITLNNVFPETYEEASIKNDNYIDFTVIGKNTNNKPVYYEIDLEYGDDVQNKERIEDKYLRFELLDITNSDNIVEIFSNERFNSIDNERIFIDTINTTNYTKTYRLRMWYDENIIISDTESNASFKASNNEYQTENSSLPLYTEQFASVKVKVYGDFEPKRLYNVMGTLPSSITSLKNNITEIYFINEKQDIINQRYNNATIKADVTNTSNTEGTQRLQNMSDYGLVLAWLEPIENTSNYKLYIGSEGYTYLSTGYQLFNNFTNTTTIDLTNVRTNFVTSLETMFRNCSSLTSLDVSNFNTSNVRNMGFMFFKCSSLTSLDVGNFNTSNVTDMQGMFYNCSLLTSLDVSNFNTSNVTYMGSMFSYCLKLTSLDVSNFNTSNVTDMTNMFWGCSSFTSLDVSNFNTSNVTDMDGMFQNCSLLTSLDVTNFNTSNVTDMNYMFWECSSLTSLNLSNFNTSNVTNMNKMFSSCSSLTSLNLSNFDTSNVTDMYDMFSQCSSLTNLDVSNFNTSNVEYMGDMFSYCSSLTSLDVSNFSTSNVTDMGGMFWGCSSLTSLDLSNFNTSNVNDMEYMFCGCEALTSLDVSNFDTSNVTSMNYIFYGCSSLNTIFVSNNWDVSNVTESDYMFNGCTLLKGGSGTTYNSSHTDKTYARIDGGTSNPGYLTLKSN